MEIFTSFINGRWIPARPPVSRPNPGNLDSIGCRYSEAKEEDARLAMESANRAFGTWKEIPPAERIAVLKKWLETIEKAKDRLAERITRENGKNLWESGLEIEAAVKDGRYLLEQASRPSPRPSDRNHFEVHCPLGVFLILTPYNFPLATLVRKLVPALAYGNAAVVKPSEYTPGVAVDVFQFFSPDTLPPGTANLVLGSGSSLGSVLVEHPTLRGISFTGSTETGHLLQGQAAGRDVRLQLEMGGKNPLLVLEDADLPEAAKAARVGAFSCAGQWCTGTSRVIVEAPAEEEFLDHLIREIKSIQVGPGHLPGYTMGPVTHHRHWEAIQKAISRAGEEGARLLAGGRFPETVAGCRGYFIEPTLFASVAEDSALFREEVFGPVLAITVAKDADDAVRLANCSPYGLSSSVYTRDLEKGRSIIHQLESGITHLNLHTAYRTPDLPVSGWKGSGSGIPECGSYGRDFYTRPKAIYLNP